MRGARPGQPVRADSGGEPPHSTGCEADGLRGTKKLRRERLLPQARFISRAQLISRAPLTVASGALFCVDLGPSDPPGSLDLPSATNCSLGSPVLRRPGAV